MKNSSSEKWLRPKEAATYLGISLSTLYSWRKRGIVRFYRLGPRVVALLREDLDRLASPALAEEEGPEAVDTISALRVLHQRMYERYGVTEESTGVIRQAREARGR
ncbi:MAG: helix-turn-helix transcriptional regulator [Armatimonadota bacterium]